MLDPVLEAAHRAVESLAPTTTLVPDDWDVVAAVSIAAAEEALTPIREVLISLERNTQAPCGPEETAAARVDALTAITELVHPTEKVETVERNALSRSVRFAQTPQDLEALPNGTVYVSDLRPDVPETKARGAWWTPDNAPFEPALPGRVVYVPPADSARKE